MKGRKGGSAGPERAISRPGSSPEPLSDAGGDLIPRPVKTGPKTPAELAAESLRIFDELAGEGPRAEELQARCAQAVRERAYLIEPQRLYERALVRIAHLAPSLGRQAWPEGWVGTCIEGALRQLLVEDEEANAQGIVPDEPFQSPWAFLASWFAVEGHLLLAASVRFNSLPEVARQVFFAIVIKAERPEDCISRGMGSKARLQDELEVAFRALFILPDLHGGGTEEDSR